MKKILWAVMKITQLLLQAITQRLTTHPHLSIIMDLFSRTSI